MVLKGPLWDGWYGISHSSFNNPQVGNFVFFWIFWEFVNVLIKNSLSLYKYKFSHLIPIYIGCTTSEDDGGHWKYYLLYLF